MKVGYSDLINFYQFLESEIKFLCIVNVNSHLRLNFLIFI